MTFTFYVFQEFLILGLIRFQYIFFAGAWNGYGFHEDGVKSALNIANNLKVDLSWIDKNEKSN